MGSKASTTSGLKVNDQQEVFCQRYSVCLNATEAAIEAGYANDYGRQLIALPHIMDRIAEIQRNFGVRMIVTAGRVIRESAYLAYSDITEVLGVNSVEGLKSLPENVRKAIKRVKVTRTPIRRDGTKDRRSRTNVDGLAAMSESDQNCQFVTNEPDYEETIEIEMHSKTDALRLLALVTDAVKNPENSNLLRKPAFTGLTVKTLTASEAAENVSNEQKEEQEENGKK